VVSHKQVEANRANAKRSTGPKSDGGKSRSRMNAVKHGFSSQEIVVEGEDADEFDALRTQLEAEFAPDSIIERELVDRLAGLLWRLRRVPLFEAALIRARRGAVTNPPDYEIYYISEEGKRDALAFLEELEKNGADNSSSHDGREEQKKPGASPSMGGIRVKSNEPSHGSAPPPSTGVSQSKEPSRTTDEAITDSQAARIKRDHPDQLSSRATGLALIKDSEDHDTLSKLSRYEAGLMNAVTRTLSLIQAIQNSGLLPKK
jgi:hypothetical protein